jgi:phospholipid N-methyltransferase
MARAVVLSDDVRRVVAQLSIDGTCIRIKQQLPRPLYERVNKILELMGGRWTRSLQAHLFEQDPSDKVEDILLTGQIVDLKKEYDFFETPADLADEMVEQANIKPGMTVLEPSAGHGAIAEAVRRACPKATLEVCEIQSVNRDILMRKGFNVVGAEFVDRLDDNHYDRIVMNPPFSRQQDIDHVNYAYSLLKPGGRLVAIMSASVKFRDNRKAQEFKQLIKDIGAEIVNLPENSFKASGTCVNTVGVSMNR